jgi:uncharacterized protein (DUF58 family)
MALLPRNKAPCAPRSSAPPAAGAPTAGGSAPPSERRGRALAVLRHVRKVELTTRRAVNAELAGRYHSVFKGQGMAFAEVRPYAIGDDVRHIDWNVSARHQGQGLLYVKQFIEERELTVMLAVDLSGSGRFGTRGTTKRERLAEAAALIAFSATRNNDRVGLLLFTDTVELFVPPRKGRSHVLRVVREVLEAEPRGAGTRIGDALGYLTRVQKRRAVVFVLSDFLDEDFVGPLRTARARHDVVAVRVSDPAERTLPDLGLVAVQDPETGARQLVDSASPEVRAAYAARRRARVERTTRQLQQVGCDVVELDTATDFVRPLVGFFRRRAARMKGGR